MPAQRRVVSVQQSPGLRGHHGEHILRRCHPAHQGRHTAQCRPFALGQNRGRGALFPVGIFGFFGFFRFPDVEGGSLTPYQHVDGPVFDPARDAPGDQRIEIPPDVQLGGAEPLGRSSHLSPALSLQQSDKG